MDCSRCYGARWIAKPWDAQALSTGFSRFFLRFTRRAGDAQYIRRTGEYLIRPRSLGEENYGPATPCSAYFITFVTALETWLAHAHDPVSAADGHTYERVAIEEWLATGSRTSPSTGQPLQSTALIPQFTVKRLVVAFMETRRSSVDEDVP